MSSKYVFLNYWQRNIRQYCSVEENTAFDYIYFFLYEIQKKPLISFIGNDDYGNSR